MSSKDIPEPTLTELFVVLRDINNRIENIQNSLPTSVYD